MYYGYYEKSYRAIGPIHIKYEYGLSKKISIGISLGYHKYLDEFNWPVKGYRILCRMGYHFITREKWDVYWDIGIGAGEYESSYSPVLYDPTQELIKDNYLVKEMELGIGARFYFTKNLGLYIEAGLGKTIFQGGLALTL